MSRSEAIIYLVLAAVAFIWGTALLVRDAIRQGRGNRRPSIGKLLGWFAIPPILGVFGFAAMMDPHGGDPVINTLRSIALLYIVGSVILIIAKLAREDAR